ncbi:hypothetical protein Tco_1062744, partial [Tanacetum coccineum]
NPLFNKVLEDIESEDSYVSKLDEPDLQVTPLSKLNEDECFDPGGNFILEEIKACLTSDSIPPGIDDDDFDPEGDILLLKKLLNDDQSSPLPPKELNFEELKDTIPNLHPEVFLDDPGSLEDEPDKDDLKNIVKVFDPGMQEKTFSPTYEKLPFENRHYLSLTYVIRIFLPYFTYPVESSLPLSSGSEDIIFDPGISTFHFSSLEPVSYESPMEVCSSTYPFVEIPSGESKVHIEVLSVLWGNRLPIPDGSLPLSSLKKGRGSPGQNKTPGPWSARIPMWQLFKGPGGNGYTKNGQKRCQNGQNRARNWKEREKSKPKAY